MNLVLQDESDKTIFISYASEDSAEAERLYKDLKNAGAKPWIDKEEITAGMRWKLAIRCFCR
jgi:TIR domain